MPSRSTATVLLAALLALPAPAPAQVHRCTDAEGRTVFSDQRCADIGAYERVPATPAGARGGTTAPPPRPGGCPRTLGALVQEIAAAVRSRDVNRLSAVYDWNGVDARQAARVFDQLEAIVARPLVDIAPVRAESAPPPAPPAPLPAAVEAPAPAPPEAAWMPSWAGHLAAPPADPGAPAPASADASTDTAASPPAAPRPPRPVGLRLEQTLAGTATPVRTVFGLRRHYGCFWIRL